MATDLLREPAPLSDRVFSDLIEAASRAPSPDNNQPWMFRQTDGAIDVFHDRRKALPSDVNDMFSWIAIGAAIENLVLRASVHDWAGQVEYQPRPFDNHDGLEHVATVTFEPGGAADPLADWIEQRVTNRKLYRREPVSESQLRSLNDAVLNDSDRLVWLTTRPELKKLARLVRQADRIRFEHQPFHDEFHKVLRYGDEHARAAGDGLELKTLEVPAIAGPVFRWLRPWKRMRFANRLGMSRMFAGYSAKQVIRSGAIGYLATSPYDGLPRPSSEPEHSDRAYLEGGRSFQRLWLAATQAGLAFQPLGGLPLFLTKLRVQGPAAFQPGHARIMASVADGFRELYSDAAECAPVMLFRIGHAPPPSARSIRFPNSHIVLPEIGA